MPDLVVVCPIIVEEGRVLLVKSGDDDPKWKTCGGRVEPGEDLLSALFREVREELGISVRINGNVFHIVMELPGVGIAHFANYQAERVGKVRPGNVYDWRWFPINTLHNIPRGELASNVVLSLRRFGYINIYTHPEIFFHLP